ncbi:MAG: hypothetical protein ACRDQ4_07135 [Pseudonocardiaceae bacterium]
MSIAWGSLLVVFVVTFGVAVAVVVLVSLGLVGLSARTVPSDEPPARVGARAGTVIGGLCLLVAAAIIAFGVYIIVV